MKNLKTIMTTVLLSLMGLTLHAQEASLVKSVSTLEILGTSTIHDWVITCEGFTGTGQIAISDNKLEGINNLKVTIPVKGLDSGKGMMDDKTYEALKEEDHPYINYNLTEIKSITAKGSNTHILAAKGKLTIAGVTRDIAHNVNATILENKAQFSGEYTLDMTAYSVEPPTAMMGSIKTGKEVTIKFKVTYQLNHKN